MEPGSPQQQWNPPREQFGPQGGAHRPGSEQGWQAPPDGPGGPGGPGPGGPGGPGPGGPGGPGSGGFGGPGGPDGAGYPPPAGAYPPAGLVPAPPRARTGLIVLIAFLVELVLIAALENDWVSKKVARHSLGWGNEFARDLVSSLYTFSWKISGTDPGHRYLSGVLLDATVLVVSVALIATVVRGSVTFGRAFFGTWMAVIVATMIGGYVRAAVLGPPFVPRGQSRLTRTFFSAFSSGSGTFIAGLGLGFIVAVVTAIVAMTTRRRPARPAGAAIPESAPAPFFPPGPGLNPPPGGPGEGPSHAAYERPPAEPARSDEHATTQFPSLRKDSDGDAAGTGDQSTARFPDADAARGPLGVAGAGGSADEATTSLPRFSEESHGETTQLPRMGAGAGQPDADAPTEAHRVDEQATDAQAADEQATDAQPVAAERGPEAQPEPDRTTAFPRPPDDEELSAHPDHDWPGERPGR